MVFSFYPSILKQHIKSTCCTLEVPFAITSFQLCALGIPGVFSEYVCSCCTTGVRWPTLSVLPSDMKCALLWPENYSYVSFTLAEARGRRSLQYGNRLAGNFPFVFPRLVMDSGTIQKPVLLSFLQDSSLRFLWCNSPTRARAATFLRVLDHT